MIKAGLWYQGLIYAANASEAEAKRTGGARRKDKQKEAMSEEMCQSRETLGRGKKQRQQKEEAARGKKRY